MSTYEKPLPRVTPDNKPFWDGCRAHELRLPSCAACGAVFWPAGPVCPACLSDTIVWNKASGRGAVTTFVVVHQRWFPSFADDIPYNVVQVELDEGPRITASLVGAANEDLAVGMAVEAVFDDVTDDMTLPRFRPAG